MSVGQARKALTISELTRDIRLALEESIGSVWVEGEVSNLRKQPSGHQYFSLKDDSAQLRCVLFRGHARRSPVSLEDGMQVLAEGEISVYESQGQYQLVVRSVQPKGLGELQARFEALKRRLDAEGLFDPERKHPIPRFPQTLLLITSPTSAAIRDMLNILGRRAPWVRVLVAPVRVQGEEASREIAEAFQRYTTAPVPGLPPIDTVIVGRGGGSIEDLWCFNEEIVARAIAECPLPVVSAVGHEIDFTIADFVADLRAPTPSAAAELVVPDREELSLHLERLGSRCESRIRNACQHAQRELTLLSQSGAFREPGRVLTDRVQRVDELLSRMRESSRVQVHYGGERIANAARLLELSRPDRALESRADRLEAIGDRLRTLSQQRLRFLGQRLEGLEPVLRNLGPTVVLRRGFSLTTNAAGEVVFAASQLKPGDRLTTRFSKGSAETEVREVDSD